MKFENKAVPLVVIKRLPRYYRHLGELVKEGVTRVSSGELSARMGITASQIRQDFNCFGGFGQQGYGYNVETLHKEIGEILGLQRGYKTIIIGAGNLGHALANHSNFERCGFSLIGIFDEKPELIGTEINHVPVLPVDTLEDFCRENMADIAILALPNAGVDRVVAKLVNLDIKGIWNFSYADLNVPDHIAVENVHLSDSLMTLAYQLRKKS